ncbi:hypothetical protein FSP39_009221 [Pinctada imbricata]|uniref:Uncharacterized protein n=1 Tax=Pinctada imbricata TaxID=66713 RepID=A0AA88YC61_PINIB|nr:hypothetical protein FSP39_009221 [Pinctada imbricata]
MNWIPFLERLCEEMGFLSDAAKLFAKNCQDLHKSWKLLLIFHTAALRKLVSPYVRHCIANKIQPSPKEFLQYSHTDYIKNPTKKYFMDQVFRFSQGIINFRMAVRRNNAMLLNSAKFMTKELFYARTHPKYQQIELYDHMQYLKMPVQVRQLNDMFISITTSGNMSTGEDFDFVLKEKNKELKQWITSGIPTDSIWQQICRINHILEKIKQTTFKLFGIHSSQTSPKKLDLEDAINAFRAVLRKAKYFDESKASHLSLKGQELDSDLVNFIEKATLKRSYYLKTSILQEELEDLPHMSQPVAITKEERESLEDTKNKTKSMIENEILYLMDNLVEEQVKQNFLEQYRKQVKGKRKAEYI